jgi:hypothetical protein
MALLEWLQSNPRFALLVLGLLYVIFAVPLLRESHRRLAAQRRAQHAARAYFPWDD